MTREEKLEYVKSLNWDYTTPAEDMLDVIEGRCEKAGPFNAYNLFVRSYQGLKWHIILELWGGIEPIRALMAKNNARLRRTVMPVLRSQYDEISSAVLLGKPLPESYLKYNR